jgi:peptidoglycan/LPS O-acetylase OafA/YrhL
LKIIVGSIVLAVLFRFVTVRIYHESLAGGVWTFGCMDSLGLGGLLAFVNYHDRFRVNRERFLRWSLLLGCGLLVSVTILYFGRPGSTLITAFLCLACSLIFMVLIARAADGIQGWAKPILEAAPLLYMGRISYGLYVYHNFMPGIVKLFYVGDVGMQGTLVIAAAATVLTFAAAMLSWHFIEKPISRWKSSYAKDSQPGFSARIEAQRF